MAKAQEMLKDPQYMAAAKAKLAELEAKAKARGLLDENGMPVQGAATAAAMGNLGGMGQGAFGGAAGVAEAADWEIENIARHKAGQLNTAELGMAQLRGAMQVSSLYCLSDWMSFMQLLLSLCHPFFLALSTGPGCYEEHDGDAERPQYPC